MLTPELMQGKALPVSPTVAIGGLRGYRITLARSSVDYELYVLYSQRNEYLFCLSCARSRRASELPLRAALAGQPRSLSLQVGPRRRPVQRCGSPLLRVTGAAPRIGVEGKLVSNRHFPSIGGNPVRCSRTRVVLVLALATLALAALLPATATATTHKLGAGKAVISLDPFMYIFINATDPSIRWPPR